MKFHWDISPCFHIVISITAAPALEHEALLKDDI